MLPNAESTPVSSRNAIPLMVTFDELEGGLVKPVARHGFNSSTTTTSRYFSTKFVPAANGSRTRALLSDKTDRDELAGSMNVKSYSELT